MTDETSGGPTPVVRVEIEGSALSLDVRTATVEDNDRLIDKAVVEVLDLPGQCTDFVAEGNSVTVEMGWQRETAILFEGIVTKIEPEMDPGARRTVTVTAYDKSYHLMTREPRPCSRTGLLSAILTDMVTSCGIAVGQIEPDPDPEFTEENPLIQVGKTDWQLIQDLTIAYGGRAFVEYNEGESKFYFITEDRLMALDSQGMLRLCRGFSQLQSFRMERVAGWAAMQRTAATIDAESGEVVGSTEPIPVESDDPTPPDPRRTSRLAEELGSTAVDRYNAAAEIAAAAASTPADQRPRGPATGVASDPRLVEQLIRVDPTRIVGLRGEGVANGTVMLRAKGKVTLEGTAAWSDGDWYVHKAVHAYRNHGEDASYRTEFVVTR